MQIIMWGEMLRKSFTISVYSQNNERGKGQGLCGKGARHQSTVED